jgi:RHS repeat-associated protein
MNQLREYQRGILSEDTGSGGHVISTAPALSIVERPALSIVEGPALSIVEGPALSIVEGITLPGTDSVYSWTLDSVGNWRKTERTPVGGAAASEIRTHNKLHQVVKAGDVALAYDKSGNMTDDGSRTFVYDAFNRIRTVKRKADSLTIGEYTYDAHGRRIRKTISNGGLGGDITNGTTDCLYAGNQCVEERQQIGQVDTPVRQYVWGLYIDELIQLRENVSGSPADYYPLQDLLYRTTALTDSAGDIVETYDTDAYGRTLAFSSPGPDGHWFTDDDATTSQPRCEYIFTGRQYDPESELYYYRARYYNPTLGRFMQRDPVGYRTALGLQEYVGCRPSGIVDPLGLFGYDHGSNPVTDPMSGLNQVPPEEQSQQAAHTMGQIGNAAAQTGKATAEAAKAAANAAKTAAQTCANAGNAAWEGLKGIGKWIQDSAYRNSGSLPDPGPAPKITSCDQKRREIAKAERDVQEAEENLAYQSARVSDYARANLEYCGAAVDAMNAGVGDADAAYRAGAAHWNALGEHPDVNRGRVSNAQRSLEKRLQRLQEIQAQCPSCDR